MRKAGSRTLLTRALGIGLANALVWGTALADPAAAGGSIEQTESVPPTLTDWAEQLTVDQFDNAVGVLVRVTLDLAATISGSIEVENLGNQPATTTVNLGADVGISQAGVGVSLLEVELATDPLEVTLDAFDGTNDADGPSGATITDLSAGNSVSGVYTDPAALDPFIGAGTITFEATSVGMSSAVGSGNVTTTFFNDAGADLTITYDYLDRALDIEKTTLVSPVPVGDDVEFGIVVTNTGEVDLTDVVVLDAIASDCDRVIGTLAAGDFVEYSCTLPAVSAGGTNSATVTGTGPDGVDVSDTDDSDFAVLAPAIDVEKTVNGDDADTPGLVIPAGTVTTFEFVVTNTGALDLENIALVDDVYGPITCPATSLAIGASMACSEVNGVAAVGTHTNTATVTGETANGTGVTDDDLATYEGTAVVREDCPTTVLDGILYTVTKPSGTVLSSTDLTMLAVAGGDTVTMSWDSFDPGFEGCVISLALYKTHGLNFDITEDQQLTASVSCQGNNPADTCVQPDGTFSMSLTVPGALGCPFQLDAITGAPLGVVGPSGGYYSAALNGGVQRLFGAKHGQ